jgi:hypothetical protein
MKTAIFNGVSVKLFLRRNRGNVGDRLFTQRRFIHNGVAIEDAAHSPKPFRALWDRRHQTRTRTKRDSRTNDATFVTLANVVT